MLLLGMVMKDIGVGRVGYDPVNQPDGNAFLYSRTHIPLRLIWCKYFCFRIQVLAYMVAGIINLCGECDQTMVR